MGPFQSSFLVGQSTTNNLFITQEVVHSMKMQGQQGMMIMKFDLHKPYDSIDWGFLLSVFLDFGIAQIVVELVMLCVKDCR